jgi:hypothetical protein
MKKVQTNKTKKLTLGKMTVARLQMGKQQMRAIYGGEPTKPTEPANTLEPVIPVIPPSEPGLNGEHCTVRTNRTSL